MKYTITGTGVGGKRLSCEKGTLGEAGYLASKMIDQGVADVQILDANGSDVTLEEAWEAFRRSPPPGWTIR